MYYEVKVKHTIQDAKGNDKEVADNYIVKDCELFAEAEQKGMELFNGECDVVAVKRSQIREFANEPKGVDGEAIYLATLADIFINENGTEKKTKYKIGVYANDVSGAEKATQEYMKQGLQDMECEGIKKTSFMEVL